MTDVTSCSTAKNQFAHIIEEHFIPEYTVEIVLLGAYEIPWFVVPLSSI